VCAGDPRTEGSNPSLSVAAAVSIFAGQPTVREPDTFHQLAWVTWEQAASLTDTSFDLQAVLQPVRTLPAA
jgi:hypothetical protein